MERFSYLKSVAVVLFAAVCAYMGALIFPSLSYTPRAVSVTAAAQTHIGLEGIALRQEKALTPPRQAVFLPGDSQRVAAGALIWQGADGEGYSSGKSAVFVSQCDGYEHLSPPEDEKLSMAKLREYLNASPSESPGKGRLTEGFYWYYAACAPTPCPAISKGIHYLKFEGFENYTKALLVSIDTTDEGSALLFRLKLGDGAYLKLRKCRAELLVSGLIS